MVKILEPANANLRRYVLKLADSIFGLVFINNTTSFLTKLSISNDLVFNSLLKSKEYFVAFGIKNALPQDLK
jgi:hypothetical protein